MNDFERELLNTVSELEKQSADVSIELIAALSQIEALKAENSSMRSQLLAISNVIQRHNTPTVGHLRPQVEFRKFIDFQTMATEQFGKSYGWIAEFSRVTGVPQYKVQYWRQKNRVPVEAINMLLRKKEIKE